MHSCMSSATFNHSFSQVLPIKNKEGTRKTRLVNPSLHSHAVSGIGYYPSEETGKLDYVRGFSITIVPRS